jgi:hypothetical protein
MQLTARQRQFARIAGWALPVSVILGAVFGHFNSAPNNSVWPYIQGAIAGILISAAILSLEFVRLWPDGQRACPPGAVPAVSRAAFVGLSYRDPHGSRRQRVARAGIRRERASDRTRRRDLLDRPEPRRQPTLWCEQPARPRRTV